MKAPDTKHIDTEPTVRSPSLGWRSGTSKRVLVTAVKIWKKVSAVHMAAAVEWMTKKVR